GKQKRDAGNLAIACVPLVPGRSTERDGPWRETKKPQALESALRLRVNFLCQQSLSAPRRGSTSSPPRGALTLMIAYAVLTIIFVLAPHLILQQRPNLARRIAHR